MSARYSGVADPSWLQQGSPTSFRAQNMDQLDINSDLAALTTQIMTSVGVPVQAGSVVTNITFKSGATAAGTPTNWFFALYDSSGALLAQSADQLTAAWGANTVQTLALTTAQTVTNSGWLFAAVMVKATTVPTLIGASTSLAGASAAILSSKVLAQTSGSALTTTAPTTIATPTTVSTVPFVVLT